METPKDQAPKDGSPKESDYHTADSSGSLKRIVDGAEGESNAINYNNDSPDRLEDRMNLIPTTPLCFLPFSSRTMVLPVNNSATIGDGYPLTPHSAASVSAYHTPIEGGAPDVYLSGVDSMKTADS